MKYMLMVCVDPAIEWTPADHALVETSMEAWLADTIGRGVNLHGGRLQPVATATTVRIRNGRLSVTDGPFAETKEQLAGFYLIEARDLNEAIQIAAKIPPAEVGCVEVRPIRPIREQPRSGQAES